MRIVQRNQNIKNDAFDRAMFQQYAEKTDFFNDTTKQGKMNYDLFPELMQDLFYGLYKNAPELKDDETINSHTYPNREILTRILDSPKFKELHPFTRLNEIQSSMASAVLGEIIVREKKKELDQINKQQKQIALNMKQQREIKQQLKTIEKNIKDKNIPLAKKGQLNQQKIILDKKIKELEIKKDELKQKEQCLVCSDQIIKEALDESKEHIKIQNELFGMNSGNANQQLNPQERIQIAKQLMNNKKILQIAKLAGRFRRLASQKQKEKTKHEVDEVTDVMMNNDIARLIPSEILKVITPELETIFAKDYTERSLVCYELSGTESKVKGPIVVCVDVSGSMEGEKEIWAKAVALALVQIAHKENRNAYVIPFESKLGKIFDFSVKEYSLPKVMEMAAYWKSGGTNFNPPLSSAIECIQKNKGFEKADIIFITDGEGNLSSKVENEFIELKTKTKTSMYTVLIGGSYYNEHKLKRVSDYFHSIEEITDEAAGDIFQAV